uniref:tryptophan--tRNA ligase n=1 Tax=Hemiselmis tepida TaxID=464990 RepID=A0A7S0VG95_9CRYP
MRSTWTLLALTMLGATSLFSPASAAATRGGLAALSRSRLAAFAPSMSLPASRRGIAQGRSTAPMRGSSSRIAASPLLPSFLGVHSPVGVAEAGLRSPSLVACRAASTDAKEEKKAEEEEDGKPAVKKRVISGVQPTGNLHLGNYLGAIRQWAQNQDEYENYFFVVDLHAITMPHSPAELTQSSYDIVALYLACGIDPTKSRIFIQSHVPQHAELCWLLNCVTPMGWMEKMIQYKEKAKKQGESVSVGLFDYPILMAADILIYQAQLVPVGEDQRQHLELARDIARRFNDLYCKKKSMPAKGRRVFRDPEALIVKEGARIMSLEDGRSKMSKSDPSEGSRINLSDSEEVIRKKIKRCKTDNFEGIEWDNPDRPECTNLLNIFQACSGRTREDILAEVSDMKWGEFKPLLADVVVDHLAPIQARYKELVDDKTYLHQVLREGAEGAEEVAAQTLTWTKNAMGFTSRSDLV